MPGKQRTKTPQPELNIFPGNWTIKTQQMLKAFELSFAQNWNPVMFPWDQLDGKNFDPKPRIAQAYWMTKLALFEKSGIGAFGFGAVRAAELNLEDPTKKMLPQSPTTSADTTKSADAHATSSAPTSPTPSSHNRTLRKAPCET